MDVTSTVFAFDVKHLLKDGMERCFEMNRADNYASLCDENAILKEENNHLRQLQCGSAKSLEAVSDGVMTSMPEVSMCTVCDESASPYYNPVPGMNTILSCVEKKVATDTGPTPTLTVNVREKMEEIRQMFYEGDSARQHQETLAMGTSTVESGDVFSARGPSVPVYICKDAPAALTPDHLGGLRMREDKPTTLQLEQPKEPLGLRIFKDPDGLAALGAEPKRPRQPLRTITHASAVRHPPLPSSDEENLGFVAVAQEATARIDSGGMTVSNLTLPIVFDPPCASTSVFTGRLVSSPASTPSNPDVRVQLKQRRQQLQDEEEDMVMEMSSPSPSPSRPDSPLADAFNLFVHSPDPSGRLRIDATKFMDAFLAKKAAKMKDSENKRPPFQ
ncbi:hypothetical protein TcWFU_008095 [Taenia crassiceps]|uniref:Uncharacterized protein n=1 Tax=Taenia crassiceps TaxID=6207 RepID=A0ABR4QA88_9CEST